MDILAGGHALDLTAIRVLDAKRFFLEGPLYRACYLGDRVNRLYLPLGEALLLTPMAPPLSMRRTDLLAGEELDYSRGCPYE